MRHSPFGFREEEGGDFFVRPLSITRKSPSLPAQLRLVWTGFC
ncbi:hypothetical protein SAMN02799630_04631 [Paenibacillus sp. UNCCL117]|nr:hypothetical protein SAMN04488602_11864 [Paenibacillus sp. cl123]SFW59074.1 hypothetical protein SAMN02799630_04631 [Paenibacillus sp. UNCCL117]